jgi:hypothetical protein
MDCLILEFGGRPVRQRVCELSLRPRTRHERRPFHGLFHAKNNHHAAHKSPLDSAKFGGFRRVFSGPGLSSGCFRCTSTSADSPATDGLAPSRGERLSRRMNQRVFLRCNGRSAPSTAITNSNPDWEAASRPRIPLAARDMLGPCRANDAITGSPSSEKVMPMKRAATYSAAACRRAGETSRPISASQGPGKRPLPVFSRVNTL